MKHNSSIAALIGLFVVTLPAIAEGNSESGGIRPGTGQVLHEEVGQGINYSVPGEGAQFGYFSYVREIESVFTGVPENETTAVFTFYQELANVRIVANGPMRIISREGVTTVYLNSSGGANFANPDSFRAGVPIQTSVVRQQVVIDTVTQSFTAMNEDVIASSSTFMLNGRKHRLGKRGDMVRTMRTGRLNSPGLSPIGWFGGYSVAAEKAKKPD